MYFNQNCNNMENVNVSVSLTRFQVFCYLETNWQKFLDGNAIKKENLLEQCQKHFRKYFSLKKDQVEDFFNDVKETFEEWFSGFLKR